MLKWPDKAFRAGRSAGIVMMLVRCYTCKMVFDIDRPEERKEAISHSQACHEMTQGFRA